ncbi:MAG: Ppx/GppA phosphatase family protein [Candidatus Cohnella colombiensis]|uniref:Chaperone protein DnaK n=1 Tax=Candidatus Cohnella colombiensis TaxID=3121368 RepID=A0AA95EXQ5_9BACL|nr:MAG: Ppx/GppA phosphatase family protein [Cohnella sp.]
MMINEFTGIIDIGSNTVRLAVYQLTENGAYRVIDQGRWSARLSQRMTTDGLLPDDAVNELIEVLRHYQRICQMHGAVHIRAVATAALRQAVNQIEIMKRIYSETGLTIEILSGEDEARIGSHAMLCTMPISDGFVVDIGGGSTEVSLLIDRKVIAAISIPIGCVNTASRFGLNGTAVSSAILSEIKLTIQHVISNEKWMITHPKLPLVGLGGTVRALAKLEQLKTGYPYSQIHGYELSADALSDTLIELAAMPANKRKKHPGLSKDRSDVIVPGLAILLAITELVDASHITVCGVGIRDGLFLETCLPQYQPQSTKAVLEESIRNLIALYPTAPESHLAQVQKLSLSLYDRLSSLHRLPSYSRRLLDTASRLFRLGAVIDFNDSDKHTFYMLLNTHWNGLSHREIILTAAVASYSGNGQLKRNLAPYRALLSEGDSELAAKLGVLLQFAASLDRSEAQAIHAIELIIIGSKLHLIAHASHPLPVEQMEAENMSKEFKKAWGLTPKLEVTTH